MRDENHLDKYRGARTVSEGKERRVQVAERRRDAGAKIKLKVDHFKSNDLSVRNGSNIRTCIQFILREKEKKTIKRKIR